MKDNISLCFALAFFISALAVLFLAKDLKYRGMIAFGMLLLSFATIMRERVTEFVFSYKEIKVTLEKIENRLSDIAKAMETLTIAQQINKLEDDNSIILDYEPIPQSVRIIVGPITHFPRENYGYRLEGKKIYILHPNTLQQVTGRLPGGVTVEYLRKIKIEE